jgi:hypothetical protein
MKKADKEYCIETINKIINNDAIKLSKENLENLIVVREKIKIAKTKKEILKLFKFFLIMFGIGDFFDDL